MALAKDIMGGGFSAGQAKALQGNFQTVAAAGTSQATGAAIRASNVTVTSASGTNAVVLPNADIGDSILLYSSAATNALLVFPPSGGNINAAAANASFSAAAQTPYYFTKVSATQWLAK